MALKLKENQLLAGFSILLALMGIIGLAGIWKIQSLGKIIDTLGRRNLAIEKSILEMKISNTVYAMGVRNYVLWQTSKYLQAASTAANPNTINKAAENFNQQLKNCSLYFIQPQQKTWIERLTVSVKEWRALGDQIIALAKDESNNSELNSLLLDFETNFYKINAFMDETLAMSNFTDIDRQISLGYQKKSEAIFLLSWVLFIGLSIGLGTSAWIYQRRKLERRRRETMVSQILNLEERERQNLAAQIHDQMAQDLSALRIYTGIIEQTLGDKQGHEQLKENAGEMKSLLSGLIEKTHNICMLLRPPALDELGLIESIEALILEYKRLTGINYIYLKPGEEIQLPAEYSLLLYRLTQEALTNSAKYARAKNVSIALNKYKQKIELSISDDGVGFDYNKVVKQPRRRSEDKLRLGLIGLQERVELLGGAMLIESAHGRGTRIVVTLSV